MTTYTLNNLITPITPSGASTESSLIDATHKIVTGNVWGIFGPQIITVEASTSWTVPSLVINRPRKVM